MDRRDSGADGLALHALSLDGSAAPRLLASDVSPVMPPAFSPDGSSVLFFKEGFCHMRLLSVPLASEPATEPSELASFRVSPEHLSCLRSKTRILVLCFMEGYFSTSTAMHVYDIGSGALREIELPVSGVKTAALSASGGTLAFSDGRKVWVQDLDDPASTPRDVSSSIPGLDRPLWLALSPDGSLLCLRSGRLESKNVNCPDDDFAQTDLKSIHYKVVDTRRLLLIDLKGSSAPETLASESAVAHPSFSPDSKRLLYVQGSSVLVYDLASKSKRAIHCPRYEYGRFVEWFDGSRIAYRDNLAKNMDARVWLVSSDGKGKPSELWTLAGGKAE